ncbi:hypothetical protein C7B62_23215 [Pleurocapsa sp. CCALA 161]|uniref:hypothetical protein n=1 Tax=Pleurocapsa sp. CCALA 161 TaxID=2107688 RepID=UPI000D07EBD3|nr:hypothetical protein [Pleurocapsa sp. CCALA 161]PSB06298.1 hypothetical protein C7B62_23215 [Pleurocapsa sp. CCALA 161]
MVTSINWTDKAIADISLKSVYQQMNLNNQSDIPLIIRLFENPRSPIALPGKISLHNHDCLHIILGLGVSPAEEAFIIGFTMGNDDSTKIWHVRLFKFIARFVYPLKYRIAHQHLNIFDLGFEHGKNHKYRNLNQIEFDRFYTITIKELRELFDINYFCSLT